MDTLSTTPKICYFHQPNFKTDILRLILEKYIPPRDLAQRIPLVCKLWQTTSISIFQTEVSKGLLSLIDEALETLPKQTECFSYAERMRAIIDSLKNKKNYINNTLSLTQLRKEITSFFSLFADEGRKERWTTGAPFRTALGTIFASLEINEGLGCFFRTDLRKFLTNSLSKKKCAITARNEQNKISRFFLSTLQQTMDLPLFCWTSLTLINFRLDQDDMHTISAIVEKKNVTILNLSQSSIPFKDARVLIDYLKTHPFPRVWLTLSETALDAESSLAITHLHPHSVTIRSIPSTNDS